MKKHNCNSRSLSSRRKPSVRLGLIVLVLLLILPAQSLWSSQYSRGEAAIGVDISRLSLDSDTDPELNPGGLRLRLGYQLSTFIDVAGHLGFSFSESTDSFDDITLGYFAGFLKGYLPVGGNHAVYGLLGFSAASLSQDVRGGFFREDRAGFSWGVGAEVQITNRFYLNADFVSYLQRDGLFEDISAVSLGVTFFY